MPEYQGHRSKAAWNVALWIGNDEGLYRMALACLDHTGPRWTRKAAARLMFNTLRDDGIMRTPDGYAYSVRSIYEAMEDLED